MMKETEEARDLIKQAIFDHGKNMVHELLDEDGFTVEIKTQMIKILKDSHDSGNIAQLWWALHYLVLKDESGPEFLEFFIDAMVPDIVSLIARGSK